MPRDLYLTALLRNTMQAANTCCVFVGNPHWAPIQNYWQPPPHGVNYTQACTIPKRIPNETDEIMIEGVKNLSDQLDKFNNKLT